MGRWTRIRTTGLNKNDQKTKKKKKGYGKIRNDSFYTLEHNFIPKPSKQNKAIQLMKNDNNFEPGEMTTKVATDGE